MDPNPKTFPLLSYVLTRLHSVRNPNPNPSSTTFDIEQPQTPSSPSSWPDHVELMERMPHLSHPGLLDSMSTAIADVAQTRSVLRTLGDRPDHESVDFARARISEIDAEMSRELQELVTGPRPEGVEIGEWRGRVAEREAQVRKRAEREKQGMKAVVQLDEMHEAYQGLLKEAEERLVGIYGERVRGGEGEEEEEGMVNEEVVKILQSPTAGSVERVDLSGKKLRILPEAFCRLRTMVVLNLSGNQLETIPDSLAGLEHLEELHLSSNQLISLPDSIGLLLNLKILDVSGNKLKKLPDSISHCRSLVELNASYNELSYLPTNIGLELVSLQKLMIYLNKLRTLPSSVCEMRSLRHLDAHFNEIHGLPHAIGKLKNLEILDLSSNFSDLTELPETFGDLILLRELDLSNNQIHALPDTFGRLGNLIKLNLDQNPVVIPPADVIANGVQAVKEFMVNRLADILEQEEQKRAAEAEAESRTGWLSRSSSWLNNWASGVSGSVSEYMGAGQKSNRDPFLDQQL